MPPWGPTKRRVLIAGLRSLGFEGPFSGGKHEFMVRRDLVLTIPNPHKGDIGAELLALVSPPGADHSQALGARLAP